MFLLFWPRSVAPINSSNVSLPTPSLDLPDVADVFARPADNASKKRESNESALHDSRSKIPRMQSLPRGMRSAAGKVSFFSFSTTASWTVSFFSFSESFGGFAEGFGDSGGSGGGAKGSGGCRGCSAKYDFSCAKLFGFVAVVCVICSSLAQVAVQAMELLANGMMKKSQHFYLRRGRVNVLKRFLLVVKVFYCI